MTDTYEQKVLFWLREMLLSQDLQIGSGGKRIMVDEVYLEPEGTEGNSAVIVFREKRRPHCRFGFRFPLRHLALGEGGTEEQRKRWSDPEGTGPQVDADMIVYGYLTEQIEAANEGLPQACEENSITWL